MRFRPRRAREEPEINLIPLIDVLLVILIFLMITTTYSRYTELKVNLPTAEAEKATERPGQIVVSVTANGVYSVDKQVLDTRDVTSLADALRNFSVGRGVARGDVAQCLPDPALERRAADVECTVKVAGRCIRQRNGLR